jgi:hypothetical protein
LPVSWPSQAATSQRTLLGLHGKPVATNMDVVVGGTEILRRIGAHGSCVSHAST